MDVKEFAKKVQAKAEDFGFLFEDGTRKTQNAVWRENIRQDDIKDFKRNAFFGLINADEEPSGIYSDFSLVIFPNWECTHFVISLTVGSNGFNRDYAVASGPWMRRLFGNLRDPAYADHQFFKVNFSDIETPSAIKNHLTGNFEDLKDVIHKYQKFLTACQLVEIGPDAEEAALNIVWEWLATYAVFRDVGTNQTFRNAIDAYLPATQALDDYSPEAIYETLMRERFIVLQGAPGTGKTWTANKISQMYFSNNHGTTFFEQFHAETTYSDFVYGIWPKTDAGTLSYEERFGVLCKAIESAQSTNQPTLLIIDEINRANLSNVLGPVFYLFEKHDVDRQNTLKIGNIDIRHLPNNLFVIATMNTADRSLAVVDFALRRRFSWITLRPHEITAPQGKVFLKDEFEFFMRLFNRYAKSEELNLQPGQSYFIANNANAWKARLRYELVPLMKEYFNEGYLQDAIPEFNDYVYTKINMDLYE